MAKLAALIQYAPVIIFVIFWAWNQNLCLSSIILGLMKNNEVEKKFIKLKNISWKD